MCELKVETHSLGGASNGYSRFFLNDREINNPG